MKNKIAFLTPILCALLLLMQGCSFFSPFPNNEKSLHNTVLKTITDTMTPRPDVALEMIVSLSDTLDESRMSKIEYYEYQILIAEALYKNDYQQTNDSAIIAAVDFFDSLALKYPKNTDVLFQKARAHYYKGVGEQDKEKIVDAANNYFAAIETLEEISDEKEDNVNVVYFKALTNDRLAWIYFNYNSFDIALGFFENSNICFKECNQLVPIVKNNKFIASIHFQNENYNDALKTLNETDSLSLIVDVNVANIRDANSLKALCLHKIGRSKEAYSIMGKILQDADNEQERMTFLLILGEMYYADRNYDLAVDCFEQASRRDRATMIEAANCIVEICKITGDDDKIVKYAPLLAKETMEEISTSAVSSDLSATYEQYIAQQEARENKKMWSNIIVLVVVFALLTVGALSLNNILKKRRHRKDIERKDIEIQSLNKEISDKDWLVGVMKGRARSTSKETDELKEKLKKLQDENNELKSVSKQEPVDNQQNTIKKPSLDECIKELTTDETCRRVAAMNEIFVKTNGSYPDMLLDSETQRTVVQTVERILGDSLRDVMPKGSKLKFDDKLLLSLCLLGLDDKHIAVATGLAYSTVYRRMQRMLGDLGELGK